MAEDVAAIVAKILSRKDVQYEFVDTSFFPKEELFIIKNSGIDLQLHLAPPQG